MPPDPPRTKSSRTQAQRDKANEDRRRQRRNVQLRAAGEPTEKTPLQLEREQKNAAGVLTGSVKKSAGNKRRTTRPSDVLLGIRNDDYDDNASDDDSGSDGDYTPGIYEDNWNYQGQPSKDDILNMHLVNRNGVSVPRLPSSVVLTPEQLASKNGLELARILGGQTHAALFEMVMNMKHTDIMAWRKLQHVVTGITEEEATEDKYPPECFESDNAEFKNHLKSETLSAKRDSAEDNDHDMADLTDGSEEGTHLTQKSVNKQPPKLPKVQIKIGTNADEIMNDLMKGFNYHHGERAHSSTVTLQTSERIKQDRENRFQALNNAKLKRQERVQKIRTNHIPTGFRAPAVARAAFDVVSSQIEGPKGHWNSSAEWFMATLDVINSDEDLCLAMFEPKTHFFLEDLKSAMLKADQQRNLVLLEQKTLKDYADLMGAEPDAIFQDSFLFFKTRSS